jgi:hypothetical protein
MLEYFSEMLVSLTILRQHVAKCWNIFFGPTFSKLTLFCLLPNHRRRRRRVGLGARGLGRGSPASSRAGARGLGHGSPASLRVGARGKAAARAWRTRTGGGHSGCSKDARRTAAEGLGRSGRAEKVAAWPVAAAQPPGGRPHALVCGGGGGREKRRRRDWEEER